MSLAETVEAADHEARVAAEVEFGRCGDALLAALLRDRDHWRALAEQRLDAARDLHGRNMRLHRLLSRNGLLEATA